MTKLRPTHVVSAGLMPLLLPLLWTALAAQTPTLGALGATNAAGLPAPFATTSSTNNSRIVPAPAGWMPSVADGFTVGVFADSLLYPRWLAVAPSGDIFVAETRPAPRGAITVLHPAADHATAAGSEDFITGLQQPFGIAFHGDYVYVGENAEVVRYRFDPKTSKRLGEAEHVLDLPRAGEHFTRSLAFSADGRQLFISVGSDSNYGPVTDEHRAAILVCDPDGGNARIYAGGLRNAVGIAINPVTHQLWASVNERDELGDNVPPDYFTSVRDGGFYGWPYSYIGQHVDPRVEPQRPDLVAKAIVPDYLLAAHVAPLQFQFYTGRRFPARFRDGAFIAEHGSWNRSQRDGYQILFVPFKKGQPVGDPMRFLYGFVPDPSQPQVYGRPVGVAVATDGSLLVSDDGAHKIWRINYTGK